MRRARLALLTIWALLAVVGPRPQGAPAAEGPGSVLATSPLTGRWSELTSGGGQLPAGAELTAVVQFDGRFVAAGAYFGSGPDLPAALGCPVGCNPTVWTSSNGASWSPVFANPASGGIAAERLLVTPVGLLLFNTDEGTAMWRSSNGASWHRASIAPAMAALGLAGAAWGHGRVVAIFNNKYVGTGETAYGEADTIWTSTGGGTWHQDNVPGGPAFSSLTSTANGFVAAGTSRTTGQPALWRSSNGLTWTAAALPAPAGSLVVATDGSALVTEDVAAPGPAPRPAELWCSAGGQSWRRATVEGGPIKPALLINPEPAPVMATSGGLVAWGDPPTKLWWSRAGCSWSPVVPERAPPPSRYQLQGLFPDQLGLVAVAAATGARPGASAGETSIWQVEIISPARELPANSSTLPARSTAAAPAEQARRRP